MSDKPNADHYALVLADLKAKRDELDHLIEGLEKFLGAAGNAAESMAPSSRTVGNGDSLKGAFLGLNMAEAARKLLAMRREPMKVADIVEALRAAGMPMTSKDPNNIMGTLLKRRQESLGDVVRVERGAWGLREWYPNRQFKAKSVAVADTPKGTEEQEEPGKSN